MHRHLLVAGLIFFAQACQDPTSNVAGYYDLTAVDSLRVPRLVTATTACDQLVLRGWLYLANDAAFDLSVTQSQDCTRVGGAVDTFTTITSGAYTLGINRVFLHPSGTGLQLEGITGGGIVEVRLPQLPLLSGSHSGSFLIFPL